MEITVNRPIVETFGWLKVGGKKIEVPDEINKTIYSIAEGDEENIIFYDNGETNDIEINLSKNAKLNLIHIKEEKNIGGESALSHSDIRVKCADNSNFHWYRIVLDGRKTYDNCSVSLEGKGSSFNADIGYRLSGEDLLDVNCEAIHTGCDTASEILSSGVLKDRADKLLRGTIDFRQGAKGAVGNEIDDVLMMDRSVRNRTVPVILCAEEDVAGNHGATIGRPDENILYYMKSRGIDEKSALKMLSDAKLAAVIEKIPEEKIKEELKEKI
ncbi:MAG: SufD family Fe-S cluster assembly protein [Lachnospiraceae bacterium]|nr:SufD family Fe-S cluster assembly protein [Lachnospiraceae bacterium]